MFTAHQHKLRYVFFVYVILSTSDDYIIHTARLRVVYAQSVEGGFLQVLHISLTDVTFTLCCWAVSSYKGVVVFV